MLGSDGLERDRKCVTWNKDLSLKIARYIMDSVFFWIQKSMSTELQKVVNGIAK